MVRDANNNGRIIIVPDGSFDLAFTNYLIHHPELDRAVILSVSIPPGTHRGILHPDFVTYLNTDWGAIQYDIELLSCGKYLNRLTTKGLLFDEELVQLGGLIPGVAGGPTEFAMHGRNQQIGMH